MSKTSENENWMSEFNEMVGSGFVVGAGLTTFMEFLGGFGTSSKGQCFISGIRSIHNNVPRIAENGSLGALCWGIFSATELAIRHSRKKDDKWNWLSAGTFTSFLINYYAKKRLGPAVKTALTFGCVMYVIDDVAMSIGEKAVSYSTGHSQNSTQVKPVNASSPTD